MNWLAFFALAALTVGMFAWIFWDIRYRLTDIPAQADYDFRVAQRAREAALNEAWAAGRDDAYWTAIACAVVRSGFVTAGQVAVPLEVVA